MTIYFIQLLLILFFGIAYNPNKNERRKKRYIVICWGLLILVASLRKYTIGIDLQAHFANSYLRIASLSWSELPEYAVVRQYGVGYVYLCKVLTLISPDIQFFIATTSFIVYGTFAYFVYKHSDDVVFSTVFFVCYCLYYMFMNIIRQSIALALVLIAVELLNNSRMKSYIRYALFVGIVVVASSIHTSAILCLILLVFTKISYGKKEIVLAVVGSCVAFVLYDKIYGWITALLGDEKYTIYINSVTEGKGSFNTQSLGMFIIIFLIYVLAYYTLVWRNKKRIINGNKQSLTQQNSFLMYSCLIALICRLLLFKMNIINRLSYYFIPFFLLLAPRAIGSIRNITNRKIIRLFFYMVILAYFVIMSLDYAATFYGVIPYEFYWN